MWNGKKKAVTFSFDDSVIQDKRCIEILERSPSRITPNCDKYEKCGGCSYLHTSIEFENQTKENFVKSAFAKNKIQADFEKIICPVSEKYRNKVVLFYNGAGFGYIL